MGTLHNSLRNMLKKLLFVLFAGRAILPVGYIYGSELNIPTNDDTAQWSTREIDSSLSGFHEFCDIHFNEGLKIATICEFINRNIFYRAEGDDNDYWQQPKETLKLGTGDCEDVVLLFAYLMRLSCVFATYCWGECQNDKTQFAHTWIELQSRDHKAYIVELFSSDVSYCIIPSSEDKWIRKRHVMIEHTAFCGMAETKFVRQKNVFSKLNEVFVRK